MLLTFHIHDSLAVGYYHGRWALTLCRGGFQFATGLRVAEGDRYGVDYCITEFLEGTNWPKDKELISYKVQDKMVMGWLACDSGEWTYPLSKAAFDVMTHGIRIAANRPPFAKGEVMTCRTKLIVVEG